MDTYTFSLVKQLLYSFAEGIVVSSLAAQGMFHVLNYILREKQLSKPTLNVCVFGENHYIIRAK